MNPCGSEPAFGEATVDEVRSFFRFVSDKCMRVKPRMLSPGRLDVNGKHFAARKDGQIIGAVAFRIQNSQWELATIFVLKRFRGKGFGTSFARFAIQQMIDLGITPLYVDPATRAGRQLFKGLESEFGNHLTIDDNGEPYDELPEKDC